MTRGEVFAVLGTQQTELWDDRSWSLSLLTPRPMDTYEENRRKRDEAADADKIEDLPKAEQDWLRAV